MKKLLLLFVCILALRMQAQELPPNAVPGKCYIKCTVADELKEESETIQITPSYKKLRTVPATFKTVELEVLVKEPSVKKVFFPATYETVLVEVSCEEAQNMNGGDADKGAKYVNYRTIPAQFGSDNTTIQVAPKVGKWEYTQLKECPSANKEDCIVACYVERPGRSINVPITTLTQDARVEEVPIPCVGFTYKKQVIKTPAREEEIAIPAEYATVKRRVIDQPAQVLEEVVPATSKNITKTYRVDRNGNRVSDEDAASNLAGSTTVWEEVDCNMASGSNLLPINYDLNSALLTDDAKSIINDKLLTLMNQKKGLRIEIMSHTDSRSDDSYNMALSQQRAQSVVNYLVSNGISRNRLVARGYGESRLKNNCGNGSNCSEEDHAANRRTEFRILR